MKVLAIETSCDETGVAIVEGGKTDRGFSFKTLGAALLSQAPMHSPYGGVYPNLAKREHLKNLPIMLSEALNKADMCGLDADGCGISPDGEIDALVVTKGPGLEPALWTGIEFAKKLAGEWNLPLFGANHMEGHLISSLARRKSSKVESEKSKDISELLHPQMPVLALLVSGGHTEFIVMRDWFSYERIGETLDDAVGECFDKVARMLGLPYPGGPEISRLAARARMDADKMRMDAEKFNLPRPMLHSGNCDVSFSGLKTAALYALRDVGGAENLSEDEKAGFAREFEDTVVEVFLSKTKQALQICGAQTFVIGGGVAANKHLRESLVAVLKQEFPDVEVRLPELSITGDNAVMIAEAALAHLLSGDWQLSAPDVDITAKGNLSIAG